MLNIDIVDQYDNTLLHYAVFFERSNVIPMILHKGAYVNCRNSEKETPLHYAVRGAHCDSVIELLKHPDINIRALNGLGKTADFYAYRPRTLYPMSTNKTSRMKLIREMFKNYKKEHDNSKALRSSQQKYKSLK